MARKIKWIRSKVKEVEKKGDQDKTNKSIAVIALVTTALATITAIVDLVKTIIDKFM